MDVSIKNTSIKYMVPNYMRFLCFKKYWILK
ncbi:hypothetical protein MPF_1553 [Methanohalophilus portucalensis FDF-1]|uniref:Uncharacterized protein n=1 Tax=Methanohalophilus portucalensis FDF-1 TaxID=523843 RepID=A0A1L9C3L3_9EURY|nr:hypothetical protein MPF_1553 [Methanohalophilus portucalensis FDF-1]